MQEKLEKVICEIPTPWHFKFTKCRPGWDTQPLIDAF